MSRIILHRFLMSIFFQFVVWFISCELSLLQFLNFYFRRECSGTVGGSSRLRTSFNTSVRNWSIHCLRSTPSRSASRSTQETRLPTQIPSTSPFLILSGKAWAKFYDNYDWETTCNYSKNWRTDKIRFTFYCPWHFIYTWLIRNCFEVLWILWGHSNSTWNSKEGAGRGELFLYLYTDYNFRFYKAFKRLFLSKSFIV